MKNFFEEHLNALGIAMGIVFAVGIGFMAQRLLDWDRPCLRFSGVIELHVDGVEAGLRSCQETSRFVDLKLSQRMIDLSETINELGKLDALLPRGLRGVFVTVTDKDPFFMLFSERSLVIGSEIARSPQNFQRAILSAVAFQSFSGEDDLEKQLRADLLWYLFAGDDVWTDATSGIAVNPRDWMKLASAPVTVGDYCSHPLRQIYDLSFCRFELDKDRPLSNEKRFESLISWSAYRTLKSLGLSSSTRFLRSLFESDIKSFVRKRPELQLNLAHADGEEKAVIKGEVEEELKTLDSFSEEIYFVQSEVQNFLNPYFKKRLPAGAEAKERALDLNQSVREVWSEFDVTSNGSFDFVVEVDTESLRDVVLNSLNDWQKNTLTGHGSKILVVSGAEQIELPGVLPTHYPSEEIQSKTHLLMACELPDLSKVAELHSTNLIAVKVCKPSELPRWADILSGKTQAGIEQVRLKIHLPSLKRWSKYRPNVLAKNGPLDRVFCQPETFIGYPFEVENCPDALH